MILGDNIFYGNGLTRILQQSVTDAEEGKASIFAYYVQDPQRFGVVDFDESGHAYAKQITPSQRGELEITDLNRFYLDKGDMKVKLLGRGYAWLDTGTMDTLVDAANFVRTIEKRQGIKMSVPEEIAFQKRWIDEHQLEESVKKYGKSGYGEHLQRVLEGKIYY